MKMIVPPIALTLVALTLFCFGLNAQLMYVGTNTGGGGAGILAYRFNPSTGDIASIGHVAATANPTFLAVHPNGRVLYAVNETAEGGVSAFSIDAASGALKLMNRVSSHGDGPCHVSVDAAGKWVFTANYSSGTVAAFPVHSDGSLGEATASFRQSKAAYTKPEPDGRAHSMTLSPDNRFVVVADLGLDRVYSYRVDAATGMALNTPPFVTSAPGAGPRHVAFQREGKFAYVVNELNSTIDVFKYDARNGGLTRLQTIATLPAGFSGKNSGAEVVLHPNGKFLYSSNRGHDSIAIFSINAATGNLSMIEQVPTQGRTPRNFAIDPSGAFLLAANQDSGNIIVFRIDAQSGKLTSSGKFAEVAKPTCIVFCPR
jgi:6-phosphogluconolactonase